MPELMTRCPSCHTDFQIARTQLKMADGMVRCGACLTAFNGIDQAEENRLAGTAVNTETSNHDDFDALALPAFDLPMSTHLDDLILKDNGNKKNRGRQISVVSVLLLALAGQYSYFHSDVLILQPMHAQWISKFCQLLNCPTPPPEDRSAIHSRQLQVYSSNHLANALVVDAIIDNQAPFSQTFPRLLLQFENIQGEVISARVFEPKHYLHGNLTDSLQFPATSSVHIQIEIVDPGSSATNYALLVAK